MWCQIVERAHQDTVGLAATDTGQIAGYARHSRLAPSRHVVAVLAQLLQQALNVFGRATQLHVALVCVAAGTVSAAQADDTNNTLKPSKN